MNKRFIPPATVTLARWRISSTTSGLCWILAARRLARLLTDSADITSRRTTARRRSSLTLFTVADDIVRLRRAHLRLKDPNCHAEYPPSNTRRLITNVRHLMEGDLRSGRRNFCHLPPPPHEPCRASSSAATAYKLKRTDRLEDQERAPSLMPKELGAMAGRAFCSSFRVIPALCRASALLNSGQ